jgi:N-acylneuraminate cytidylyltransferase
VTTTCIIPARGGSKGIALKNVLPLCGRPLLAWSVRQAMSAAKVDRVVVTTDDDAIAAVAEDEGVEVFWRSPETATDTASTESAVLEVITSWQELPDYVVLLQATSPIRQPHDIDLALTAIENDGADSLFAARRVEGYVWQHSLGTGLVPLHGGRMPRQLRPETVWEENGSLYVFRPELFLRELRRHCGRSLVYEMDPLDSFQIDDYADIQRIEQLLPLRISHAYHAATH